MTSENGSSATEDLLALCRQVYLESTEYYETKVSQIGAAALGFAILYGLPLLNPDTLFLDTSREVVPKTQKLC